MSGQEVPAWPDNWQELSAAYKAHVERWERRIDALVADLVKQGFGVSREPGRRIVIIMPSAILGGSQQTGGS